MGLLLAFRVTEQYSLPCKTQIRWLGDLVFRHTGRWSLIQHVLVSSTETCGRKLWPRLLKPAVQQDHPRLNTSQAVGSIALLTLSWETCPEFLLWSSWCFWSNWQMVFLWCVGELGLVLRVNCQCDSCSSPPSSAGWDSTLEIRRVKHLCYWHNFDPQTIKK